MEILLAALDFVFGCHHKNLSRIFTRPHLPCVCDCGARLGYSLKTMPVVRRLPSVPVFTRFRTA